jgi:hypothetical protein
MSVRGIFSGLLTLTILQAVLSSSRSAERAGGVLSAVGSGVYRFMSPTVAAIPDLRERRKTVAPGEPPRVPYDSTSATMPADWNTRPAPPRAVAT